MTILYFGRSSAVNSILHLFVVTRNNNLVVYGNNGLPCIYTRFFIIRNTLRVEVTTDRRLMHIPHCNTAHHRSFNRLLHWFNIPPISFIVTTITHWFQV